MTGRAQPDLRKVVLEDLLRTGQPTCMTVLVARLGRGRSDLLRALRALEIDNRVIINIGPKLRDNTTRERSYQAAPGATLEGLDAPPPPTRLVAPPKHQEQIEAALQAGPATSAQVAEKSGVSITHARKVLQALVEDRRAVLTLGPPPATGSVRARIYSWVSL